MSATEHSYIAVDVFHTASAGNMAVRDFRGSLPGDVRASIAFRPKNAPCVR